MADYAALDDALSRELLQVAARRGRHLDLESLEDGYVLDTFVDYAGIGKQALVDEAILELPVKKRQKAAAYVQRVADDLKRMPGYSPFKYSKRDFLDFYDASAIGQRQKRWAQEAAEPDDEPLEDDFFDTGIDDPAPAPPPLRVVAKVGRNDRCPCGSGKKYKKCCEGK